MNEVRTSNVNRVIIIPYGYTTNLYLSEARQGDILMFKDGRKSEIEDICVLWTASPIFNLICNMIYGLPAQDIIKEWREKYKNDIQYDHAIVVTYSAQFLK